jgi:hypothetical protein
MNILIYITIPGKRTEKLVAEVPDTYSYEKIDEHCIDLTEQKHGKDAIMYCWVEIPRELALRWKND